MSPGVASGPSLGADGATWSSKHFRPIRDARDSVHLPTPRREECHRATTKNQLQLPARRIGPFNGRTIGLARLYFRQHMPHEWSWHFLREQRPPLGGLCAAAFGLGIRLGAASRMSPDRPVDYVKSELSYAYKYLALWFNFNRSGWQQLLLRWKIGRLQFSHLKYLSFIRGKMLVFRSM